ncbi:hypothetical protein PG985_014510 [Apiospora marii]|uniref:Uncharacterized protein n=1 Tax=Apiospora marii TaxID=335849 RepID=A0ABR1R5H9_9PEZI
MRFFPFVITSLLAFAHSAWADDQPPVGTWTLSNVRRSRSPDNTTCNWSFALEASEIKGARPPAQCKFEVRGTKELGCDKHDLGNVPCTDGVSHYSIGGGWSNQGFVVISIVNPDENAQAYFGYSGEALNSNNGSGPLPSQDKEAYRIASRVLRRAGVEKSSRGVEDAAVWTISSLIRGKLWQIYPHSLEHVMVLISCEVVNQEAQWINLAFTIEDDKQNKVPCNLHIEGPVNTNLSTWSWYDQTCTGSEWSVSMGYVNETDSGIMTLVSPARTREAFFGFPKINAAQGPMSAGPEPASNCNCA